MFIVIKNIDFDLRSVSMEVTSLSKANDGALRAYITKCCTVGYGAFQIAYPVTLAKAHLSRLRELSKHWNITLLPIKDRGKRRAVNLQSSGYVLRSSYSLTPSAKRLSSVEYTLRSFAFDSLLRNVKDFAPLIGFSVPLHAKTIARLRLVIYELAVNSIEHGTFLDPVPQVEVSLAITPQSINVRYKDNATMFRTSDHGDVSIENQIKTRRKRGLGLSIIGKVSTDLTFERKGKWNCTTFALERRNLGPQPTNGRKTMEDFSIELIPFNAPDTAVLRPKGSIDSTSAPALEHSFNEAIKNEQYRIVIDLSKTDFISSAGLGLILGTVATLRESGGDMILMKIPKDLSDVFELMSVDDYFETIDSLDELKAPKA